MTIARRTLFQEKNTAICKM